MPSVTFCQLLRAPDPTQPSNSRAARSIQREPAHEPMKIGGPPAAAGHVPSCASPTRSPAHSFRIVDRSSPRRRKRDGKSMPSAAKSAAVEPAPTPSRSRPPDTRCVVRIRCARSTGFRRGICKTPVPSSIRLVTVAATESAMSGSGRRNPRPIESKTHALSKPAASMRRAPSARLSALRTRRPSAAG